MASNKTVRTLIGSLIVVVAVWICTLVFPLNVYGLEIEPYTPGENYYIDEEEAFRDQDIDHEEAVESSASTSYYLTSPFYLDWVSPDETIYVGEQAFIGCSATGFGELHYEWFLSEDGGESFQIANLTGPAHTIADLEPTGEDAPYLYRCVITNGDRTSTLTAEVHVTVLEPTGVEPKTVDDPDDTPRRSLPQTGDNTVSAAAFAGSGVCAALALMLALMRPKEREE